MFVIYSQRHQIKQKSQIFINVIKFHYHKYTQNQSKNQIYNGMSINQNELQKTKFEKYDNGGNIDNNNNDNQNSEDIPEFIEKFCVCLCVCSCPNCVSFFFFGCLLSHIAICQCFHSQNLKATLC